MHKLFQNLIWPAVAGNIAWAFFYILVSEVEDLSESGVISRLIILLLLAIYLCIDWLASEKKSSKLKKYSWIGDAFHAPTMIVFAIAVQLNNNWMFWSLMCVFGVPFIGHLVGCWEPKDEYERKWFKRLLLSGINSIGLIILLLSLVIPYESVWVFPVSIFPVILLWGRFRDKIYKLDA